MLAVGAARADTFESGRVSANFASLGGVNLPAGQGVKTFGLVNGVVYAHKSGNTVFELGEVAVPNYAFNTITGQPTAGTPNAIIATFALRGTFTGSGTQLTADFDPITGNGLAVVSLTANNIVTTPVNSLNPATWLGAMALNGFTEAKRPTAIIQGPPGGNATDQVLGFNPATVNTATTDSGQQGLTGTGNFKFDVTSGTFLDYTNGGAGGFIPPSNANQLVTPALFLEANLQLQDPTIFGTPSIASLNALYLQLTGIANAFNGWNPQGGANTGSNGDTVQTIIGNVAVPGADITPLQVGVPEPTSILAWCVVAGGVGLYRGIRRRRK
jgi:hypothetical protein